MAITHPLFAGDARHAWRALRFKLGGRFITTFVITAASVLGGCAGQPMAGAVVTARVSAEPNAREKTMPLLAMSTSLSSPSPVSEITLERDCFGCATGWLIRVASDGKASLTVTGKSRHGTVDQTSTSAISHRDYEGLAQLLVMQGFFDMLDSYDDPQQQDGAWSTVAATRDGQAKRVFSRAGAQPDAVRQIEAAIDNWRAQARWTVVSP
jgi:hypothetical protein